MELNMLTWKPFTYEKRQEDVCRLTHSSKRKVCKPALFPTLKYQIWQKNFPEQ